MNTAHFWKILFGEKIKQKVIKRAKIPSIVLTSTTPTTLMTVAVASSPPCCDTPAATAASKPEALFVIERTDVPFLASLVVNVVSKLKT